MIISSLKRCGKYMYHLL